MSEPTFPYLQSFLLIVVLNWWVTCFENIFLKFCFCLKQEIQYQYFSVFEWLNWYVSDSKTPGPVWMVSSSTVPPNDIFNAVHIYALTSEVLPCYWLNVGFLLIELRRHRMTLKIIIWSDQRREHHQSASMHSCSEDAVPGSSFFNSCRLTSCAHCNLQPARVPTAWLIAPDAAACPPRVGRPLGEKKTTKKHFATCSK